MQSGLCSQMKQYSSVIVWQNYNSCTKMVTPIHILLSLNFFFCVLHHNILCHTADSSMGGDYLQANIFLAGIYWDVVINYKLHTILVEVYFMKCQVPKAVKLKIMSLCLQGFSVFLKKASVRAALLWTVHLAYFPRLFLFSSCKCRGVCKVSWRYNSTTSTYSVLLWGC